MPILACILSFITSLFLFFTPVSALNRFSTTYNLRYTLVSTGETKVNIEVYQTNNISTIYATDYTLTINQTRINNLTILDENTPVAPTLATSSSQTKIYFPFVNNVVGKDKTHRFTISYSTPDLLQKTGGTYSLTIPRLEPDEDLTKLNLSIIIPNSLPKLSYLDPKPATQTANEVTYTEATLSNKTVTAIFGSTQHYALSLTYQLQNNTSQPVNSEVAFPPETAYQTIDIVEINPKPLSTRIDDSGNLLGKYSLKPHESLTISAQVNIKLNLKPNRQPQPSKNKFTLANETIDFNNPQFNSVPLLNHPRQIYDVVIDKLSYNYDASLSGAPRRPVSGIFSSPLSLCLDYANLFVALARRSGIEAREVEGLAVTDNPALQPTLPNLDILHAWAEYYDPTIATWVQVDPTWGDTTHGANYFDKLDFSHVALAIHGSHPINPLPAGGYKTDPENKARFVIATAISEPQPSTSSALTVSLNRIENNKLIIDIANLSGKILKPHLTSKYDLNTKTESVDSFLTITPFSTTNIEIPLKNNFSSSENSTAIIYLDGSEYKIPFTAPSSAYDPTLLATGAGLLGLATIISGYLYFRRRR